MLVPEMNDGRKGGAVLEMALCSMRGIQTDCAKNMRSFDVRKLEEHHV